MRDVKPFASLNAGHWSDFSWTDNPICPHCGEEFKISDNEAWELYDESNTHTIECTSCDNAFNVSSHAKWSFSTDEQEDNDA